MNELIITTKVELQELIQSSVEKAIQRSLLAQTPQKEFYSPKEFCQLTGEKYSSVIDKCKRGRLKARQDAPKSTWQIHSSELTRYRKEATEIVTG